MLFHVKHSGRREQQVEVIAEDTGATLERARVGQLNSQLSPPTNPSASYNEEALKGRMFHVKQACASAAEAYRPNHALPTGNARRTPGTAGITYPTALTQNTRQWHRRNQIQPQPPTTE